MKYVAILIIASAAGYVVAMAALQALTSDDLTIAALVAASILNRQALIVLAGHLIATWCFCLTDSAIYYNCMAGIVMAINAAVFIKLSYEIRQALLLTAGLFWLAAVDAYLFPNTYTTYYNSFAYLVGMVDLYILYLLLGGRRLVGIDRATSGNSNFRLADLQLLQARIGQDKR